MSVRRAQTGNMLSETLRGVIAKGLRAFSADRGALFLYDPACPAFRLGSAIGLSRACLDAVTENWREIPGSQVVQDRGLLFVRDAWSDPRLGPIRAAIKAEGFRSMALVPLGTGSPPVGILALCFDRVRDLSIEEQASARTFAELSAVAIGNARVCEEVRVRSAGREALQKVTESINENLDLPELFSRICESVCQLLGVGFTRLLILDEKTETFKLAGSFGKIEGEKESLTTFPKGKGVVQRVVSKRGSVAVVDVLKDPDWVDHGWAKRAGVRSFLAVPLIPGERVAGALNCLTTELREFRPDEIRLLQDFADQAAVAIRNAQLLTEAQNRATNLEILNEIARAINSTLNLGELFKVAVEQIKRLVPCERASLYALDTEEKIARELFTVDPKGGGRRKIFDTPGLEGSVFGQILKDRQQCYFPDIRESSLPRHAELSAAGLRTILNTPILRKGECVAFLNVGSPEVDAFSRDHIDLLRSVADHLAIAMRNAELYAKAREIGDRLDNFVRGASDGIVTVDLEGRITSWNPGAETIYGYAERETVGRRVDEIFGEDEGKARDLIERLEAGEVLPPEERTFRRKDGTPVEVSIKYSALRDGTGRVVGISGIDRDITDRRRTEETLRKSEEKYRTLFEEAGDAIHIVDEQGRIVDCNQNACDLMGYTREEMLQKRVQDFTAPGYRETVGRRISKIVRRGLPPYESVNLRKDGAPVPIEVSAAPIEIEGRKHVMYFLRDITERKLAEETLRLTQFSLDHAADAVFWVTSDARFAYVNDAACRFWEFSRDALLSMGLYDINPDFRPERWSEDWAGLKQRGPFTFEARHRTKGGRVFPVEITVNFFEFDGEEYRAGFIRDITERKRAEELLRSSEEKFRTMGETTSAATFIFQRSGMRYANSSAVAITGYSQDEFPGMNFWEVIHPDFRETVRERGFGRLRGDRIPDPYEVKIVTKSGEERWVEFTGARIEFEGEPAVLGTAFDITERKRAEEAIKLAHFSIDRSADAVFWIAPDGRFLYVNEATCRYLGYSREELLSMTVPDINPEYSQEVWRESWEELKRAGSRTFETRHRAKDGRLVPVEISSNYLEFEGREYLFAFSRDITERKRLEERLRQSQKLEALGQLASGVAHDFNNALAVILGRAELSRVLAENPKVRRNLEIIEKAAHDGAHTVKRLQDFARKREDRPEGIVQLNDIVSDVVEMTRPRWKDEADLLGVPLEVEFDARAEKDTVRGEGAELREALLNLVHNALDAMPEGGHLALATENVEGDVVVSVTDTGIGMSPETLECALEPFFTTKGDRGSGLGLSLVYGILERHGGEVGIESAPGAGTTVRLTLPTAGGGARDQSEPKPVASATRRILVIEDEAELAELLAEILKEGGHSVEFATDPREGLDKFRKEAFDLVFTDLGMPEMPGWMVAREITRLNPSVPVIMLTGWGTQLDAERLKAFGVAFVLPKPISRMDLLNSVEKVFAD